MCACVCVCVHACLCVCVSVFGDRERQNGKVRGVLLCIKRMHHLQVVHMYLGLLAQCYERTHGHPVVVLPCFLASLWQKGKYGKWLYSHVSTGPVRERSLLISI